MKRLLTDLRSSARVLLCASLFMWTCIPASAQRVTDNLDRGLVAVPTGSTDGSTTNYVSWRRLAHEYFGVTYNLYKNGTLLASGLTVPGYSDNNSAPVTTSYQVAAVVNGVEQEKCAAVTPWTQYVYKYNVRCATGYIDVPLATVYDRNGNDVTANYSPNDAEFADLDGDGQLEMIIKRLNTVDAANVYPQSNTTEFVVIDAYDINWQRGTATLMWRIDCGPNMVSLNSTEINVIAYDWDMDGKAEVVLRGADNMIVYGSDGRSQLYTIGDMSVNTRNTFDPANGAQYAWTHTGNEYLLYLNGQTGALYQQMEYPLKRLEYASNLPDEWGRRGYGHNSSKYFFGAPYFDGRTPSLFMARGIYGTHKMIAMELNGHTWSERWRWNCRDTSSPWYGQGYHNFVVADVDEDGRDEIVYGSMVIDDNGKGLHTTGYGHGDAQHVSDFNPYRKGLEFFGCLEDEPTWGCNYRDATTGEVLYKFTSTDDDGRCLMSKFSEDYPGSLGRSSGSPGMMTSVTSEEVSGMEGDNFIAWGDLNFRIYWDGDLCSEILNSPGTAREAKIEKPGTGRLFTSSGCNMNNDSKNNPCFQGDLIGDWREEIVVRCGTNVRIYTSGMETSYNMPCLWFDHQYRQAMVWQMMAYNQPPHLSYFLGELEGYTTAPPPYTMAGRREISNGGTVSGSSGDQLIACETNNMTISVSNGAQPSVFIDNAPSWVQGTDVNGTTGTRVTGNGEVAATNLPPINRTYYTHTLTGGAFAGNMWLVKQGDGTLVLPKVTETYTGRTDVWAGTLQFDGTMQSSPVWMNRHTTLNTTDGTFSGGLTMEYGATLNMGGETSGTVSAATISDLTLNYGSQVVFDVAGTNQGDNDLLTVSGTLTVDQKTDGNWETYGPEHLVPVFVLRSATTLESGDYPIGVITAFGNDADTDIAKIKLNKDDLDCDDASLWYDAASKVLYLHVEGLTVPDYGGELSINVTGMAPTEVSATDYPSAANETFYLPIVSVTAPNFSGITPTVSGTFTALDGTPTDLGTSGTNMLYSEDYESATDASSWTNRFATLSLETNKTNYIKVAQGGGSGPRSAYTSFYNTGSDIYAGNSSYVMEFDALCKSGTGDATHPSTDNEIVLFGEGASLPASNALFSSDNYLFRISGGSYYGTTYTVAGDGASLSFADNTWYHYKVAVDGSTGKVTYAITNGSNTVGSGSYMITNNSVSMNIQGIEIGAARANGYDCIDNIQIYYTKDFSSYTFTEPGTLTLKASVPGYKSKTETFTVPAVYYKYYESPDYNQIQAADAASVLGSDYWNEETTTGRWANWSKTNSTYGQEYVMATGKQTSGYFDKDRVLQISYNQSSVYNQLVQGFGIGHNKAGGTCDITAANLGNSNTIVYYKADKSRGAAENFDEGYTYANDEGGFSYTLSETTTFCKFAAYLPVMLSDEESTLGTVSADCGNALVYRTGLGSGWGTMVLPYSMTAEQLKDAFGDGVKVANLSAVDGTVLKFDETTQAVTAGEPFLISGVTKSGPFVAKGVTEFATESSKSVGGIDFIGTYTNMGSTAFTTKDYFFVATSDKLTRVSRNGMKMVLKGYRAYFHDGSAVGAKSFTVSIGDEEATGIADFAAEDEDSDVFDLQGRKVASGMPWTEAKRLLRQGVYIVNGKRMIVK